MTTPTPLGHDPKRPTPAAPSDLREAVAALAHEQWSGWMKYLFDHARGYRSHFPANGWVINADSLTRWQRQMATPYADLPEEEKESDRKEADRFLALVRPPSPAAQADLREGAKSNPAMLALEGLTPGGSEYVGDIARCVQYVRDVIDSKHQMIIKLMREKKARPVGVSGAGDIVELARKAADTFGEWNESEDQVPDGDMLNALHDLYDAFHNPKDGIPLAAPSPVSPPTDPADLAVIDAVFRSPYGQESWTRAVAAWGRIRALVAPEGEADGRASQEEKAGQREAEIEAREDHDRRALDP